MLEIVVFKDSSKSNTCFILPAVQLLRPQAFIFDGMQPVIEVKHLSKQYKNIKAVDALSFTVNKGDVYGFLGQNGAGKSTTIRMLLTLIQPTEGEINLFSLKLNIHRNEILRNIGAVIEKPDVYKYLSAYNNLRLFARMSGIHTSEKTINEATGYGWPERKGT